MHIAFVLDSFYIGGSELAALRTYTLLAQDCTVSVIHFQTDGPLYDEYRKAGASMYHLPLYSITDPRNILAVQRLRRLLFRLAPDVVHSHDAYSNMVMLGASFPTQRIPWVTSRRWLDQIVRPLHARLNHRAFLRSSAVVVNSASVATFMAQEEGIPAGRTVMIPNFVDVPDDSRGLPADRDGIVTIGMVSRLTRIKRHDIAIRAVRQLRDAGLAVQLVIVGDGDARTAIETLVRELELLDAVILVGERRGGATLHLDFDVSLATSDSEGSPNSVLEAMAAGRPAVATDVGGTGDLIASGVDGFLVAPGDVGAVAAALSALVTDRALRVRVGAAAREKALREYSAARTRETLLSLYQRISR
jgi:glycosyltransferase involved in cell wall biosynthesis